MSRYQEQQDWLWRDHRKPSNSVIASDKRMHVGEVLMIPPNRFAVEREITKAEFLRELAGHQATPHYASVNVDFKGPFADMDTACDVSLPDENQQYFYAARFIGRMKS